ncbi:hypothetical protein [Sphingobacterium sp.]|uniref:hypothetical protein n=1 Tax=Sphingobacterium sp. TaxID=341027 RepID=UPI0031E1F534
MKKINLKDLKIEKDTEFLSREQLKEVIGGLQEFPKGSCNPNPCPDNRPCTLNGGFVICMPVPTLPPEWPPVK